ncbi:MAG: TolC family protein [Bryobacteraceae bacterium]|nr:TolC family protein [Bryobacteraceae bacterium]
MAKPGKAGGSVCCAAGLLLLVAGCAAYRCPIVSPRLHQTARPALRAEIRHPVSSSWIVPVAHSGQPPAGSDSAEKEAAETLPAPRGVEVTDRPPGGLTLDQVINACLLADPKLRAGFEAINQANADALSALLKPNPTLFADIQLLPLTRPFTVERQGGPPQQDVQLGYPIDWFLFGKRAAAMVSAGLGVRVSEAEYADLIRQRVTEAALGFYDVLEAKELLELARQDVRNFERVEANIRKAVEAGGRPRVELSRVRLDLLRSQQSLREAEAAVVAAKARLQAFLGRTDPDPSFDVAGSLAAPLTAVPLLVEEAFALALQNRPDLQALRWKASQAKVNIELERRKAFPEVTTTFGYSRQYQRRAIGFPDADSWSAAIEMTVPFSDRNQGNRAKASSVFIQSQREVQASEVALRAEIVTVHKELLTAYENAQSIGEEQLQLATEVRDSITKAYEEAQGRSLLDVLDAQRNYRETYRLYITSRAAYWRALYRFHSAVGQQVVPHE